MPLASRSGRINSRLPVGSPAPVRCACMSTKPGIKNFPVASSILVERGTKTDFDGPMAAICSSARKTVMSGLGGAPVASMSVTCVMARDAGGGEEQEQYRAKTMSTNGARDESWRSKPDAAGHAAIFVGWRQEFIARGGYIF